MAQSNTDQTFFFYDLETSGVNSRTARIMQFAGQRTDKDLNPIGEPYNFLIKLPEDVLPDPGAILVTGITPQKTWTDGITEAEFFKIFSQEIALPSTIFTGFNSIRFDDEFMRFGLYRNFYDAYEWQWIDGSSRWDILDISRITRALRPDGIQWPFASDGKPTNRLEYLTSVNKLSHNSAHDALSDVNATIAVAKMIKKNQPKLFSYLLEMRGKKSVEEFVSKNQTFVYVSGQYSSDYEKLTVVSSLGAHPQKQGVFVYDLREDPEKYLKMSPEQLAKAWEYNKDPDADRLPVKTLQFNRCPAIAPVSTLLPADKKRLQIDDKVIAQNLKKLKDVKDFYPKLIKAIEILDKNRNQEEIVIDSSNVDTKLYDGFVENSDKKLARDLRHTGPKQISDFALKFNDQRFKVLVPLYKARNYPKSLTTGEREVWEAHKNRIISKSLPTFIKTIQEISQKPNISQNNKYILEELIMYAESIAPEDLYS